MWCVVLFIASIKKDIFKPPNNFKPRSQISIKNDNEFIICITMKYPVQPRDSATLLIFSFCRVKDFPVFSFYPVT